MAWQLVLRDSGRVFPLAEGVHQVGSNPACAVRIVHPTVSRHHARLRIDVDRVVVEDLDSSNGTRVGGRLVSEPVEIETSCRLAFGLVDAELHSLDNAETEAAVSIRQDAPPPGQARRSNVTTLVAETASRFAMEELPALLEHARERRDITSLAARALASLKNCFEDLDFAIERRAGGALAGVRIDAEAHFDDAEAGDIRVRVRGPRQRRSHALSAAILCARLLDLVATTGDAPPRRARATGDLPTARRPDPPTVSRAVRDIYDRAERVAPSRLSVVIQGETGTGKELLARFLHVASGRRGDFVAVNCAALSRDLLEAELFGIEAGVATGVSAREGRFVQADGGTLLLDEVTEMPDDCQAKLLRVLQESEVVAVGAREPRDIDVRIIAATNRAVSSRSDEAGPLRPDLVHRLSGWRATLPPLRERSEDIPQLAGHFFTRAAADAGRHPAGISRAAMDALCGHDWPGNVRELEQEMQRAALFVDDGELLGRRHLSPDITEGDIPGPDLQNVSADAQRKAIEQSLAAHDGNATRAAEALGISRATLYRRMKDLQVKR